MTLRGHVTNGRIVVDEPMDLPEGAEVLVSVVDASDARVPGDSEDELAREWRAEIERRAERVRSGESKGRPADEVFERVEARLRAR